MIVGKLEDNYTAGLLAVPVLANHLESSTANKHLFKMPMQFKIVEGIFQEGSYCTPSAFQRGL